MYHAVSAAYFCSSVNIRFAYHSRQLFFCCLFLTVPALAISQVINWPNPEVEALYRRAQSSLAAGAYRQAIASYQQAIPLAPEETILYRDLANAYYRSGEFKKAATTIDPVIDDGRGDPIAYALASSIQSGLKEEKKAKKLLDKGIDKFPNSGYLFHERGKLYEEQSDERQALQNWVDGIAADPAYYLNYYDAAKSYLLTTKPVWTIIYGEIFVNLERQTPRSAEARKILLAAYQKFFSTPDLIDVSKYEKDGKQKSPESFEQAVRRTLYKLAPVVADGINTENLTMLRVRFTIEWMHRFQNKYSFTLFSSLDELIRQGHFDAYNQWLFGKADNPAEFTSWNNFHPLAIAAYDSFYLAHPLQMTASDARNGNISKDIFPNSK